MLLQAFARVASAREDVDLLLVGDGPLRETLTDLRFAWLKCRVRFLGIRADDPEIRALDLFALTSVSEAASLTLLEAMASGLPVVVTAVGGNPELVRDGIDGLHVPRGDASSTATAILQILDDPSLASKMGKAASRASRGAISTRCDGHGLSNFTEISVCHRRFENAATIAAMAAAATTAPARPTTSLNRWIATVF